MSRLLHLCRVCRHRATSHDGGDRGYSGCPCCRGSGDLDPEPVLVATWDARTGRAEDVVHPPGGEWNGGTTHRQTACGCGRCWARYAEMKR